MHQIANNAVGDIKMDIREIRFEGVEWIKLSRDAVQRKASVNVKMVTQLP
jgi:hypothetical protein